MSQIKIEHKKNSMHPSAQFSRGSSLNNISSQAHRAHQAGGKSLTFWQQLELEFDSLVWTEHSYSASELN